MNLLFALGFILVLPLSAQIEPFGGGTGSGRSTYMCVDRDGDGYGVGPLAVVNTTASTGIGTGVQTVTPASMTASVPGVNTTTGSATLTGIANLYTLQAGETISGTGIPFGTTILYVTTGSAPPTVTMSANATASGSVTVQIGIGVGTVLRIDTGYNMERVVTTAATSTTFTAAFASAHSSGALISDQGCLGPDGDDLDATVHSASDIASKYEGGIANTTLPNFRKKLANDILLENPGGVSADTSAQVATLRSPMIIYWLAPSTASPAGSDSNNCITASTPCQTISGLLTSGSRGGTNYTSSSTGVLVFFRDGWNEGQITIYSGTSSKYTIYMSYPGEQATPSGTHFVNIPDTSYVRLDGFKLTGGAYISAGTTNTGVPQASISWHDNIYTHIDATGPFSGLAGLNGFGQTNNVFEDSAYHDNSAVGSQHGIYIGSRNLQSTNIVLQRLLLFRNNWNGLHFNGMCSGCTVTQTVAYANGITGLDFEMGWNHSTVSSNLLFDNAKQIVFYDYESGQCPGRTLLYTFTGTTVMGSMTITGISTAATSKFQTGDIVSGPGVPSSSAITSISSTSITISNSATASATVTLQDGLEYVAGTVVICPNDENYNTIENNTIYASGADNYPSFNTPQAGCSSIFADCAQFAFTVRNTTQVDPTNPNGPQTQAGNFSNYTIVNNIVVSNGKNNTHAPIDFSQNNGVNGEACDSTCQNWMSTSTLDHDVFWQSDGNNGTNVISRASGINVYTCSTAGSVITVASCADGNPTFADVVQASYYSNKFRYDFRLLPASNALHAGSTTVPNYDLVGRAFVENTPSIGGLERNLYQQGWNTLTGAGISSAVAPANGAPLDTLTTAITSTTQTTINLTGGAPNAQAGNLILVNNGSTNELMCINGVSGTTITIGVNAACSGTASANGRGWGSTTPATFAATGTTIYYNAFSGSGTLATTSNGVYPFQSQFQQANTAGAGTDGVARDVVGKNKELCVWGGGHSNYVGNELYCIRPNLTLPTITRITNPSVFAVPGYDTISTWGNISPSSTLAQLKDGNPNAAHIQSSLAYNSWEDKFAKFGGSYAGNGNHSYDTFEFNFGTNAWERFAGASGGTDTDCGNYGTGFTSCSFAVGHQVDPIGNYGTGASGFSGLAVADPVTQSDFEYWSVTGGNGVLTQYYPAYHQHVLRASGQPTLACCGAIPLVGMSKVLISDTRQIFLQTWNSSTLSTYTVDISGITSLTPTASPNPSLVSATTDLSCDPLLKTPSPGLAYIPSIARVIGFPANTGGNTYYLMDPKNWTCTSYTVTGGPPTSPINPYIAGSMQYFPSLDVTLLVDDVGANVPRVLSLSPPDPAGASPTTYSGVTIF
ncbi:MAG TPA: hypothetical protein VMH80_14390 [Bryobacteraceae bacterium]|nr:hypothetical protein [Bryobacteraceae bacterium]